MAKGDIPKTAVITPFGLFEFEAVPLKSTTVEECARVILRSWIPLFGVPSVITSDQGAQFTSSVWSALCRFLGIVHSPTTSFHPQSNGIVERFHRQLKVSLRGRLAGTDWFHHLPLVLLGLRSIPREDSSVSASEALFGSPLVLPREFLQSCPRRSISEESSLS